MIDVRAEIEIAASPATIAGVMFDPQRYAEWMSAVERVEAVSYTHLTLPTSDLV